MIIMIQMTTTKSVKIIEKGGVIYILRVDTEKDDPLMLCEIGTESVNSMAKDFRLKPMT